MNPPTLTGVVETALYSRDLSAMDDFYTRVMGLTALGKDLERHLFYQAGPATVLLVFHPDASLAPNKFPPHGSNGPGHVAFGIAADQLDEWRSRLKQHDVAIESEMDWPRGGHSVYFRDPAGNLLELITPGIWGIPAGW